MDDIYPLENKGLLVKHHLNVSPTKKKPVFVNCEHWQMLRIEHGKQGRLKITYWLDKADTNGVESYSPT